MRYRPIHHSGWLLSICSSRTSRSARFDGRRLGLGVLFAFRPYRPWFPTAFRRADLVSGLRKRTLAPLFVVARAVASSHCHCGASFELAGSLRHSYPSLLDASLQSGLTMASRERLGPYLTLLRGIRYERDYISWCDEASELLQRVNQAMPTQPVRRPRSPTPSRKHRSLRHPVTPRSAPLRFRSRR